MAQAAILGVRENLRVGGELTVISGSRVEDPHLGDLLLSA
jgi:hypothetical protein